MDQAPVLFAETLHAPCGCAVEMTSCETEIRMNAGGGWPRERFLAEKRLIALADHAKGCMR